uniref:Uncharacterized protein n=1 Tax=Arundo donax TaxID=35708 RepID=A0A0A9BUT6_ARUDO
MSNIIRFIKRNLKGMLSLLLLVRL